MREDASNKDRVGVQVQKVRDALGDPRLQDVIERAAAQVPGSEAPRDKIAGLLPADIDSTVSSGGEPEGVPYLSRAPLVAMVQSHIEEALIVGDWGTGLPRARDVATHMHEAIDRALSSHRQVHVLHLGDVYYSGLETEDQRRFLDLWPVTRQQADAGVTSWSLNGNHDMYSGGFGYFGTLLGDPRFKGQRSPDGKPTSFFRLRSPSWDFIGIDTAWDTDVTSAGQVAVLQDPQAQYVSDVAAGSSRKLVLFSHHQLVSVYDKPDLGSVLPDKLAQVLTANRVTAWWWGHEHRAITYGAAAGVRYPRCLGNGGVPILPDPDPPAGSSPPITWRSTRTVREDGQNRIRFGFAVLDLQPDRIEVAYVDDDGNTPRTETVT